MAPVVFEFEGFTNFSMCTRHELNKEIMKAYDVVYSNWLAGEYDPSEALSEAMLFDKKARDLRDLHYCLWEVFPQDRLYRDYWCPAPKDWLRFQGMTEWPTRVVNFYGARTFSMHGPSGEVERVSDLTSMAIPVLEPIRRDSVSVARRSKRVKYARDFYYGY